MTDEPVAPVPYQVSYSGLALDWLRAFVDRARALGAGPEMLKLLQAIEHRLRVYPQFGQPLRDSAVGSGQEWVGVVLPLVIHYVIYEDRRLVVVAKPMQPLPGSDV